MSNSVKALDIVVIGLVSHFIIAKALLFITKINKVTEYFVQMSNFVKALHIAGHALGIWICGCSLFY